MITGNSEKKYISAAKRLSCEKNSNKSFILFIFTQNRTPNVSPKKVPQRPIIKPLKIKNFPLK